MITLLVLTGIMGYLTVGIIVTGIIIGLDSKPYEKGDEGLVLLCVFFWPFTVFVFAFMAIEKATTGIGKSIYKRIHTS